jgi:hypothetical protein
MQTVQQYHVYRKELRFDTTDEKVRAPRVGNGGNIGSR